MPRLALVQLLENPHCGFGLKDPWDEPYTDLVAIAQETNQRWRDAIAPAALE
ncbi:hypothetical protein [Streptomyces sp. NPDC001828]|uniref:hypothetical protein n=1 Tax=Streptomyces sp. NPDC001828 TaxID=3364615 RepID=UPI003691E7F5